MHFKNGYYRMIVNGIGSSMCRSDAEYHLIAYPTAFVYAYERTGGVGSANATWQFLDLIGSILHMKTVEEAEEYVYERCWDEDNLNYFPGYAKVRLLPALGLSSSGIVPLSQIPPCTVDFGNQLFKGKWFTDEAPKCDCGGDKCKLPHFRWCSVYKEPPSE